MASSHATRLRRLGSSCVPASSNTRHGPHIRSPPSVCRACCVAFTQTTGTNCEARWEHLRIISRPVLQRLLAGHLSCLEGSSLKTAQADCIKETEWTVPGWFTCPGVLELTFPALPKFTTFLQSVKEWTLTLTGGAQTHVLRAVIREPGHSRLRAPACLPLLPLHHLNGFLRVGHAPTPSRHALFHSKGRHAGLCPLAFWDSLKDLKRLNGPGALPCEALDLSQVC